MPAFACERARTETSTMRLDGTAAGVMVRNILSCVRVAHVLRRRPRHTRFARTLACGRGVEESNAGASRTAALASGFVEEAGIPQRGSCQRRGRQRTSRRRRLAWFTAVRAVVKKGTVSSGAATGFNGGYGECWSPGVIAAPAAATRTCAPSETAPTHQRPRRVLGARADTLEVIG